MKSGVIISVIILAVAILGFAGLAYPTVPVSTTQTATQTTTLVSVSYSPYELTNTLAYTTTTLQAYSEVLTVGSSCPPWIGNEREPCVFYYQTTVWEYSISQTIQSAYQVQATATIPYSQTSFNAFTMSSTNSVPVYATLGLTNTSFEALSILVIFVLIVTTVWIALKSRVHQSKQVGTKQP